MADDKVEDESDPGTAAFVPDFDDEDSQEIPALTETLTETEPPEKPDDTPATDAEQSLPADTADAADAAEVTDVAAAPVTVPGRYQYLSSWKLLLVILAAWIPAALIGLGLFYWWFHTIDKTATEFVVLTYVVACTVGAVLLSMARGKPALTALSFGVLTGPFASVAAAAPLYGSYYCEHVGHCLMGVLPY